MTTRSRTLRRHKLAPTPNPCSKEVEDNGHGKQSGGYKCKQARSPLNSQAVEHRTCEEWEDGTQHGTHERDGRDSRICVNAVAVYDVVEPLNRDNEDAKADGNAGYDLRPRRDSGEARPSKPEESNGKCKGTDEHWNKPNLWRPIFRRIRCPNFECYCRHEY